MKINLFTLKSNYLNGQKTAKNIQVYNYATQQTPTLADVKQRVLQIVRDYDKITADKVLICNVFIFIFFNVCARISLAMAHMFVGMPSLAINTTTNNGIFGDN